MNYLETLKFVGKCLTLRQQPANISEIKKQIKNGDVDWERVVFLSSNHLVLPALYIQLKKTDLIDLLPVDLGEYLEFLTAENLDRNRQILKQVSEINGLLNQNGIQPIYLKGVAHLLINLYENIGERMIGDVDFMVEETEMLKAAEILIKAGYSPLVEYSSNIYNKAKHYPRLTSEKHCAAVEVHRQVIIFPYYKKFSFDYINKNKRLLKDVNMYVPSDNDLIIHNTVNAQLNDKAYINYSVNLRQMYDFVLLSKRTNITTTFEEFGNFKRVCRIWAGMCNQFLGAPACGNYMNIPYVRFYLKMVNFFSLNPVAHRIYQIFIYVIWRIQRYIHLIFRAIYDKKELKGIFERISKPDWYIKHLDSYRRFFTGT